MENSNRSQIAQAFARIHGGGQVEAYSAGSKPGGVINPRASEAMRELGYDLSSQTSKSLDDLPTDKEWDFVATMIVVAAARRGDDATAAFAQTATDAQAQALRYALDHELERASAVSEPRLLETLPHHANGSVRFDEARAALLDGPVIWITVGAGRDYVTTPAVLAEEKAVVDFVRNTRGTCRQLAPAAATRLGDTSLSPEQQFALDHICTSRDRVIAGTG